MIKTNLKGKKLLLVGGLNNTVDLIDLAHRNGVKVGVADYNHGTLAKSLADYAYDVNAYDEEAMVKLIQDEHFDGVITAFNERLGPIVRKLADRLGLYAPLPVSSTYTSPLGNLSVTVTSFALSGPLFVTVIVQVIMSPL